jgi:hypothetical protein
MGPHTVLVDEEGQGNAGDVQCPRGNGCRKADVPRGVQAQPLPDTRIGLLRVAHYFTARLPIAGLWDEWKDIETGEPLKSSTMIITKANKFVLANHDRMPVLLQPNDFGRWLAGNAETELLKSVPNDYLQAWPVSRPVNSSRALGDDPTLIDPVAARTFVPAGGNNG